MSDSSKTPELSKEVLDLQKDCDRTAAMARQPAAALGAAIAARHDAATGEAAASLARSIAVSIAARSADLVKADVALTRERADDAQPRRDRDASEVLTRAAIEDAKVARSGKVATKGERREANESMPHTFEVIPAGTPL